MKNEKRLIDANALLELVQFRLPIDNQNAEVIAGCVDITRRLIENAPTVDAVVLPCKMGDIVWGIQKHIRGQQAKQGVVNQMYFGDDMRLCICVKNVCRGEWGKNVFTTKEEAEAALAKMDGDGNG